MDSARQQHHAPGAGVCPTQPVTSGSSTSTGPEAGSAAEQKPILDPDIPYLNFWFTALSGSLYKCFVHFLK